MNPLDRFHAQFLERRGEQPSDEPGWLGLVRKNALERFLDRGFPTTRDEEWRFTNVAPLASAEFALARPGAEHEARAVIERLGFDRLEWHELVFVNGYFSSNLSSPGELPDGVSLMSLAVAATRHADDLHAVLGQSDDETPFHDLNEAFLRDGAFVHVAKGVVVDRPIHFVFVSVPDGMPEVAHPRNVVLAESGSQLKVIETYAGTDGDTYWTNAVTQIVAADHAVVDHYKLQRESTSAFHIASLHSVQGRSATVSDHSLSLGARLSRHDIRAELDGEGTDLTLNGLYVVKGSQHVDHHTVIDHRVPHGTSRELYKGILDGESSGVFNGRVIVRPDAQKTDARQSNKNLLLSDKALVNTNPQLEINADDVKCAHGATIGQLDADALFYLRSRGIGLEIARRILTEGFMADVSDRIRVAAVRDSLKRLLFKEAA